MARMTQRYAAATFAGQDIADMDEYQPTVYHRIKMWCHNDGFIAALPANAKIDPRMISTHSMVEAKDEYLNARGWRIFVTPDLLS